MKKTILTLLVLGFLSSCGIKVNPIEIKDVTVNHEHSFTFETLEPYFEIICLDENPNMNETELENCTTRKIVEFLKIICPGCKE